MHLALNAYFWNRPNTGSGQYTRQLVYHLNRLISDLDITLIYPQIPGEPATLEQVPPSVKVKPIPTRSGHGGKVWFEQVGFPRTCKQIGATVAHVPYWGSPLSAPIPVIVTVHDLTTLLVREYRRGLKARLYTALVSAAARGASHVLTDSQASKQDILTHLALPEDKVTVVYLAAAPQFTSQPNLILDRAIRQKYDLPDFFALYLGGYEIHKNVLTLLQAYTYVGQALGTDYPLLLAGRKPDKTSPNFPDYDEVIQQSGLQQHVRWIGYVAEEDKPSLYRETSCFVFPSRQEGFGLPPLEALACGVPVVTTNASSLPEIVGSAAFAVDPNDARGMAGAIISVLIEDNLADDLRKRGPVQARQFSWEKTATETVLVYDAAAL
ncbi:MAG: glycosyltransferase family 4 protein [Chloroflexi bacterium]|nr:glycosyltransferase family 4 protein [Chloroflexota bacterium]MBP8057219.1 glycosyltransferase family 4 protein [Chloroflexota bacterium]